MVKINGSVTRRSGSKKGKRDYIVSGFFRGDNFSFTIKAISSVSAEFKVIKLLSHNWGCHFNEVSDFVYKNNCITATEPIKDLTTF